MIKIFCVYNEDYESQGFYDESGNLITDWSLNDAHYRDEYMGPLFRALGVQIECESEELEQKFEQYLKDTYGPMFDEEDD